MILKTRTRIPLKLTHSVHLLIFFTYIFLIRRSLSPDSIITNLHIFLALLFLLLCGWLVYVVFL